MRSFVRCAAPWGLAALVSLVAGPARAWQPEEHASLAGGGLRRLVAETDLPIDPASEVAAGLDFAGLSAWSARNDHAPGRAQSRGETVLQQLARLGRARVAAILAADGVPDLGGAAAHGTAPRGPELRSTAVENYLVHHLIALRRAREAGRISTPSTAALRPALAAEAVAIGYLADAFASDHLLPPARDPLAWTQGSNYRAARRYYATTGLYVLDGRGEVWRAFGSGLLDWYRSSGDHVREACAASLRELAVTYYLSSGRSLPAPLERWLDDQYPEGGASVRARAWLDSSDGAGYYETHRLPSLLRIPMPIAATWSLKHGDPDEHGIHPRRHYAQLRDPGHHDPDLDGRALRFLPARAAVPTWAVLPRLTGENARELIRSDPDVASVRYVQDFRRAPTYAGGLWIGGAGYMAQGPRGSQYSLGVGVGLFDHVFATRRLPGLGRLSVEAAYRPRVGAAERSILSGSWAAQVHLPGWARVHVETGYAWGLEAPYKDKGPLYAVGLAAESVGMPFTYAAVMLRVKYQWFDLQPTVGGPVLELVVH